MYLNFTRERAKLVYSRSLPLVQGLSELFLASQLKHSTFTGANDSAPLVTPNNGHTLLEQFTDLARSLTGDPSLSDVPTQRQLKRVINLVSVLWGQLPDHINPGEGSSELLSLL